MACTVSYRRTTSLFLASVSSLFTLTAAKEAASADSPFKSTEKIIFIGDLDGNSVNDIYAINPDGSDLVNITEGMIDVSSGAKVSPNGQRIAFSGLDSLGRRQVWISDTVGGDIVQLTFVDEQFGPNVQFWIDDQTVVYRSGPVASVGDLRAINIFTFSDTLFIGSSAVGEASIDYASIAPDRSAIVFAAQAGSSAGTMDLYIADIQNGQAVNARLFYGDSGDSLVDEAPVWASNSVIYWNQHITGQAGSLVEKSITSSGTQTFDAVVSTDDEYPSATAPRGTFLVTRGPGLGLRVHNLDSGEVDVIVSSSVGSGDWATLRAPTSCAPDLNGDGVTDGADLGVLLGAWGPCP